VLYIPAMICPFWWGYSEWAEIITRVLDTAHS
jgi:hypothetical protein